MRHLIASRNLSTDEIYLSADIARALTKDIKAGWRVTFADYPSVTFVVDLENADAAIAESFKLLNSDKRRATTNACTFVRV